MAFQGKFTRYSVGPGEGSAKGLLEDYSKDPLEDYSKGASQDFLLSKSLIAGLSRHLKVVLPFLL
jgi:hypothetical protein